MTQPDLKISDSLKQALTESMARVNAMSEDQRSEMYRKQREIWVRGFQPCEHGVYDFEQCGDCRGWA